MVEIKEKKTCCGCSACSQACPKKCISMENDNEGFWYPKVDKDICIECGLCEKVCPILQNNGYREKELASYAAYARNDETRLKSSSGGIFSLLAEEVISNGGVVFGAALDDTMRVHHTFVENKSNLEILRGSKYVQSDMEETFLKVRNFLDDGRKVIFSGTTCQVAGLKAFLRKEYDNLYCIDILCHGVPSPAVWKRYIQEKKQAYGGNVLQTFFRKKTFGWKTYAVTLLFSNGAIYEKKFSDDGFMKLFLSEICLRPSCHDCKFKALERPSDITLGDCWGIDSKMPEMDDDKGTSVIIVHSQKGQKWLDSILGDVVIKQADIDYLLPPTADSRKSVKPHKRREEFFESFNKGYSLDELVRLVEPTTFEKINNKRRYIWSKVKRVVKGVIGWQKNNVKVNK